MTVQRFTDTVPCACQLYEIYPHTKSPHTTICTRYISENSVTTEDENLLFSLYLYGYAADIGSGDFDG